MIKDKQNDVRILVKGKSQCMIKHILEFLKVKAFPRFEEVLPYI